MKKSDPRDNSGDVGQDVAGLWSLLAHVVTPTTIIAGLLVYFGSVRTNTTFSSLGVDQSLLGLSIQDYALRSVGSTIEPLAMVLLALLIALPAHALLVRHMAAHQAVMRWFVIELGLFGFAAVLVGVLGTVGWVELRVRAPVAPICVALGVLALGYSASLHAMIDPRPAGHTAESATVRAVRRAVFVALLALLLLWSVAVYAQLRGAAAAEQLRSDPTRLPGVVIYAPQRLYLEGLGITESPLPDTAAKFHYRYAGLRLLIRSNQRYFLLPACWATTPQARAIALPDDPSIRLEFFRVTTHPACPPAQ
ncbi:hypothetical protein [Nonomuraea dietziae]|uniref:Uncharacterized protein n=1 Tax=Nonomuraea dietziae TaxID=65515 RepID=A0A7W5V4F9_9ACTN|nr:hypothetical protein [Nonomuraea dietziae]MBB3730381.1 hypothetical protein [Nonomuraea dietziae]